jgi:hypothetical protein
VNRKTSVHVVVTYYCSVPSCDSTHVEEEDSWPGWEAYKIRCPSGWRENFGALVCPMHKLEMIVDGKDTFVMMEPTVA